MEDSSFNSWSYCDTTRSGRPCRIYTEMNGQFETEDMEAFGHGSFHFYKKRVQANSIQVGCANEKKGCNVRALFSLNGQFLKYLGDAHGPPIHNHLPYYETVRPSTTKTSSERTRPGPRIMTHVGENQQGYQFFQCPKGYVFFVNGITKLKSDTVEFEMSCAERRDGCKARITCNAEGLIISRERGDHGHVPVPVESLRMRNFEIHYQDHCHEPLDSQHVQNQSNQILNGSLEGTDTDSSDMGNVIEERTPYGSEIIGPEDGPGDFWADPVAVCSDHNYTIDTRHKHGGESVAHDIGSRTHEVVVVSADSFPEFLDHAYVPDAEVVVEIPFSVADGQVSSTVFGTDGLRPELQTGPNKIYVPFVEHI